MHILIDQSNRVDETGRNTSIAYSYYGKEQERISKAILIPSEVKKRIKDIGFSRCRSKKKYFLKLFSAGVYLLTKRELSIINNICIDQEYSGKQNKKLIKSYLNNFYLDYGNFEKGEVPNIYFDTVHNLVDGTPYCHVLANDVRKGKKRASLVVDINTLDYLM